MDEVQELKQEKGDLFRNYSEPVPKASPLVSPDDDTTPTDPVKPNPKPITFINTFFFQFINPKGIIIALVGISTFIDVQNNFFRDTIIFTIVFFLMAVSSQAAWCLTGKYMRKFATTDRFIQNFNYSMSFLLIVCVILFYV